MPAGSAGAKRGDTMGATIASCGTLLNEMASTASSVRPFVIGKHLRTIELAGSGGGHRIRIRVPERATRRPCRAGAGAAALSQHHRICRDRAGAQFKAALPRSPPQYALQHKLIDLGGCIAALETVRQSRSTVQGYRSRGKVRNMLPELRN